MQTPASFTPADYQPLLAQLPSRSVFIDGQYVATAQGFAVKGKADERNLAEAGSATQDDLERGAVVNLLDQKVANLNPDFLTYTLSKAALAAATELLARALAPRIRVNAVSPGLTLPSLDQTEAEFAEHARRNLLQRPVALADIAATVEHLLTAPSITGQNVFVDCGQRFLPRDGDVMSEGRDRPHG